jgi:hypothetical protein
MSPNQKTLKNTKQEVLEIGKPIKELLEISENRVNCFIGP